MEDTSRSKLKTILLIDDDAKFAGETEKVLVEAGYEVLQARDGNRAIQMLEEWRGKIALAIVDLALPGVNGFELIGALSRRPNSVKIIATTSVFNDLQLESATALGAHAAVRKSRPSAPFPRLQWLNTIEQLIGKASAKDPSEQGHSSSEPRDVK
jgi:two-component system, chemotaxis family, sensor histidine kinase and response regulator PixL